MATETTTLRIRAERLGTIAEVKNFLDDLEQAYNRIYTFDFIVNSLPDDYQRRLQQFDGNFDKLRRYSRDYFKGYPNDPLLFELWENYFIRSRNSLPNLTEIFNRMDPVQIVLPEDKLRLAKVNIQSPGFWEVVGSLNPLQQIREYLKDRHERKKDRAYRNRQEETKGDLENLQKQIDILKSLGYTEEEIRVAISTQVLQPLAKLGTHTDTGLIE